MGMLKDEGQGALVQEVLDRVAPEWQNGTKDPVALENARIKMGQKLDQLGGGSGGGGGGSTLSAPTSPWPQDGSISVETTLSIQWGAVSGATQYQVYFGSSSTSLSLYATVSAPSVSAALYSLNAGTTYYWKVVALAGSSSASSAVWSFTTPGGGSQTLAAPTIVWPLNGSTSAATTLTIQWSAVSGATQYQVYFGSSSASLSLYATMNAPTVTAALYHLAGGTPD